MLATYMRRMRNNNLEIRIAGSSCRPQKITENHICEALSVPHIEVERFCFQVKVTKQNFFITTYIT